MKKIAAFFDIDGTLYRDNFISELFKKLIKSDIIEEEKWFVDVKPEFSKWDRRIGTYDVYLNKIADIYKEAIKGYHKSFIEHLVKRIVQEKGGRVYVFTRERIKWHKQQGHKLISISGSPSEVVREVALLYGFDDYIGSAYTINNNGIYTGNVIPMWDSDSKKKAVLDMQNKYNLDLKNSYAYGDTAGDFSMMKLVGNPVLVNPTRELIELVYTNTDLKSSVDVIVERKDVIYQNPIYKVQTL